MAVVETCSVCGSGSWRRLGACYDPIDRVVTEFAECLGCGQVYLYQRPPTKDERRDAHARKT